MKKVYTLCLGIAFVIFTSCKEDSDIGYDILKGMDGYYELSDIEWTGDAFDWNGDNKASSILKDELNSNKSQWKIEKFWLVANASHLTSYLHAYFPGQIGDTLSCKEPYQGISWDIKIVEYNDCIEMEAEKKDSQYELVFRNKTDVPPTYNTGFVKYSNLSHYSNGTTEFKDGSFIRSYDAIFFDPVSWKNVSGKISFIYTFKSNDRYNH